jgi:NADPH2:quinone reductase
VAFRGAGLGVVRDGAWAEQVAVPDVALAAIPEGCSDQEAAALGIPGVTALDCLDAAEVGAGTTVLILGASGGVSTIAMQLAKTRGARVIAQTGSSERVGQISRYAHEVVVADAATLEEEVRLLAPEGVDVIVDPLAGAFAAPCVRLLAAGGRLVLYGASAGHEFSFAPQEMYRKNARVIGYSGLPVASEATARSQEALFALVAAGTLEVVIADELSLDDANIAISRIRENSVGGKLLLKP